MPRFSLTVEEATRIVNNIINDHESCHWDCPARAAMEAGLHYYAAEYLDGAGADESGRLEVALDRLDPDGSKRKSESDDFAKLPYVRCENCDNYYYKDRIECCGVKWEAKSPYLDVHITRRSTLPHGRCMRSKKCLEHAIDKKIKACK